MSDQPSFIRVVFVQPALPKYNVPFFKELAARDGIKLVLYYGAVPDLPNEKPDGFDAHFEPYAERKIGESQFWWHGAQLRNVSRSKADVVVMAWGPRWLSLLPALLRARAVGVSTLLWGHGYSKNESGLRVGLRKCLACLATGVVFYGYRTAQEYLARGWPQNKIHIAPNSLDQGPIENAKKHWDGFPQRLAEFQAKNALRPGPILICVGRIYPENRLDVLIKALPQLVSHYPHLKLVLVGKVNRHALELQELARDLQVKDRINWLGAIYDEEQLAPWMLSADLFCYPENIGLSILHAMGYGLPVVTGDDLEHHNPEVEALEDRENGRFFTQRNPGSLAEVVNDLLSKPQVRARMSSAALRAVIETYNIKRMADGFEKAIRFAHHKGLLR